MASNPMQRKARNSFLLGMLLTLVITGAIIGFLIMQLIEKANEENEQRQLMVSAYVLNQDVVSGQIITTDMFTMQTVNKSTVPNNATSNLEVIENYALQDKNGNDLYTKISNGEAKLYIEKSEKEYEVKIEGNNYYITKNGEKENVELETVPLVAKVDMKKNTLITTDLIGKSDSVLKDDLRKQEYNVLALPMDLMTGDYIDVRFALPTGEDYIVVSKKQVEIPIVDGIDSVDTIWMNLTEDETLTMNNAIVEAFWIPGSKLYVTKYTEPGIQQAATPTFPVKAEVLALINGNPNVVEEARNALWSRYNATDTSGNRTQVDQRTNVLNKAVNEVGEEGKSNLETKVEESITNTKTTRKTYLDSLGAPLE